MIDHTLREIDFERHHSRLAPYLGAHRRIGACDRAGRLFWASDGADGSATAETIERMNQGGFAWTCNGKGYTHHVDGDGDAVVCAPIGENVDTALGWMVALSGESELRAESPALDGLASALRDLAGAINAEHALRTEMNSLASELSERYEELHLVYNIDAQLKNFTQGWAAFQGLVDLCARHLGVDVAAFVAPSEKLTISATNLSKPIFNLDLVLVEMRGDLYRFIHAGKESVVLNDPSDPRRGYIFTDMPYKVLAAPLFAGRNVAAMLVLVNHDSKRDFTASDRKLAEVMANQFGNLMQMCRAMEEMKTFNHQMAAALIESVEAKDPYTRGHSERVGSISVDIGKEMGLPEADMDALSWGALLHDVGKIGIPDAVLCKPGPLTKDEYTFIQVHAERGCEILEHIERLRHVIPGVRHHHERIDGQGYPHGLAGKAIPIVGRIIAVADTYDSITSSRAYRAGRSHEQALAEIRRVAGTQLDIEVVEAFSRVCAREPEWIHTFGIRRSA